MNLILWVDFELAYDDVVAEHVCPCATEAPTYICDNIYSSHRGLRSRVGNLPGATYAQMHSSSHELCTPVSDNGYVKKIM